MARSMMPGVKPVFPNAGNFTPGSIPQRGPVAPGMRPRSAGGGSMGAGTTSWGGVSGAGTKPRMPPVFPETQQRAENLVGNVRQAAPQMNASLPWMSMLPQAEQSALGLQSQNLANIGSAENRQEMDYFMGTKPYESLLERQTLAAQVGVDQADIARMLKSLRDQRRLNVDQRGTILAQLASRF